MTGLVLIGGGGHCKAAIKVMEAAGLTKVLERLVVGDAGRSAQIPSVIQS